jgi:PiT family inorganic phosphate transporter
MTIYLIVLVTLILTYAFLNGFHDSCTVVSTLIASRATSTRIALFIAAIGNLIGPFMLGTAVAKTLGEGLFNLYSFKIEAILFALISAIAWSLLTWYFGIPSSSSHTIIGAMIGASIIFNGLDSIKLSGFYKILIFLLVSPVIGYIFSYINSKIVKLILRNAKPKINTLLRILQIPISLVVAVSHGANDSQKTTSLMAMVFFIMGVSASFSIPFWMIAVNAVAISIGTVAGGGRIIKTLGQKIYNIRPINGFSAQLSSAIIICAASILGGPVSSTHVVTSSIVGAGASERVNKIRWTTLNKIVFVLFTTIPVSAILSAVLSYAYINIKGWII